MLELRERNGIKNIVSDIQINAFAWAAYHANYSNIYINGKEYRVIHIFNSQITFSNGDYLPYGNYVMFENDKGICVYEQQYLKEIRTNNTIENHLYCFTDETFLKIA